MTKQNFRILSGTILGRCLFGGEIGVRVSFGEVVNGSRTEICNDDYK